MTYDINAVSIFKGEAGVDYEEELSFVTGGNSAMCGVYLEIGRDYLLGLYRIENSFFAGNDGQLTVGLCDFVREWNSVSDEDQELLEDGCGADGDEDEEDSEDSEDDEDEADEEEDMCAGSCSEFQVTAREVHTFTWNHQHKLRE